MRTCSETDPHRGEEQTQQLVKIVVDLDHVVKSQLSFNSSSKVMAKVKQVDDGKSSGPKIRYLITCSIT